MTTALKTRVVVYDPVVEGASGKKFSEFMHLNKVEDLAEGYISDILFVSGGHVRYQMVEHLDVDDFPPKNEAVMQVCKYSVPWLSLTKS